MEYIALIIVAAALIVIAALQFKHLPKYHLSENQKKLIREYGVIHFTSHEHAMQICKEGLTPNPKKALNLFEREMVWLYSGDPDKYDKYLKELLTKRPNSDTVVIIKGLTDEQIENMRFRTNPEAYVHIGKLKTPVMAYKKLK